MKKIRLLLPFKVFSKCQFHCPALPFQVTSEVFFVSPSGVGCVYRQAPWDRQWETTSVPPGAVVYIPPAICGCPMCGEVYTTFKKTKQDYTQCTFAIPCLFHLTVQNGNFAIVFKECCHTAKLPNAL